MQGDCVRKLKADMGLQGFQAAGGSFHNSRSFSATRSTTEADGSPAQQAARDLVATLDRMFGKQTITPGSVAAPEMQHSQTEEVADAALDATPGSAVPCQQTLPCSTGISRGRSRLETQGAGEPRQSGTPRLASPTSRWWLAAQRAASFKSHVDPGSSAGMQEGSSCPGCRSPAADLLAEITRAVSPSRGSAAGVASPPRSSPSFPYQLGCVAASPLTSPSAAPAASCCESPSEWQLSPLHPLSQAASPTVLSLQQTHSAAAAVFAQSNDSFEQAASCVLAELRGFAALERQTAAEFTARVASDMARLFALQID